MVRRGFRNYNICIGCIRMFLLFQLHFLTFLWCHFSICGWKTKWWIILLPFPTSFEASSYSPLLYLQLTYHLLCFESNDFFLQNWGFEIVFCRSCYGYLIIITFLSYLCLLFNVFYFGVRTEILFVSWVCYFAFYLCRDYVRGLVGHW